MQLIIGNRNYSSWSLRPWLLLSHFGLEFECHRITLDTDEFASEIQRYSKAGKVPVLIDKDTEIWDSLAICEYVSEQYLDGRGWPAATLARAQARSASAEMHSSFTQLRTAMPMNCRARRTIQISDGVRSEINRIDELWNELRNQYGQSGAWLFGEFSIVDCMYAPIASRFHTYQPELSDAAASYIQAIINHPQVRSWYQLAQAEPETLETEEVGEPG